MPKKNLFKFNAPQYYDFAARDNNDNVESFFGLKSPRPASSKALPKQRSCLPTTVPQTPSFMKKFSAKPQVKIAPKPLKKTTLSKTKPVPFSFEKRDEQLQKQKEEFIKKIIQEEKKHREFHANPCPKIYLRRRSNSYSGACLASNSPAKSSENNYAEIVPKPLKQTTLSKTIPVPFSFEKRDELLQKQKEEFIQKTIQEEKKHREFHANPFPKIYLRRRSNSYSGPFLAANSPAKSSSKNKYDLTTNAQQLVRTFKARPANVLKTKPFVPKKEPHHLEINEFNLHVERRLQERKEFERHLQELEETKKRVQEERQQEKLRMLEEEKTKLRKIAEYKAQPVKKYKPFQIKYDTKITIPITPQFSTYRKLQNKDNYLLLLQLFVFIL